MSLPAYFLMALIAVESGGNDRAVNRDGQTIGCLQISRQMVTDVNRIYGTSYRASDRLSRESSLEICQLYLGHYCSVRRLHRKPTLEDAARIWNGGPDGWKKPATRDYARRVIALCSGPARLLDPLPVQVD